MTRPFALPVAALLLLPAISPAVAQVDSSTITAGADPGDHVETSSAAWAPELSPVQGPAHRVDQVSVFAAPLDVSRVSGSAHVIDEKELERFGHDDVHRVLVKVPGVYLRDEDGYGLRPNIGLRGGSADRSSKVTLLEDGVLFGPAPYSAPAAYYFPMMRRISRVEVFKGPAAIQHGPQTIGGAVNLHTRAIPSEHAAEVDLAGGRFGTGRAHGWWGIGGERAGILLEGMHVRTDGFKEIDGGGDAGFHKTELMMKGRYGTSLDAETFQRLELKLGFSDEVSNETYLGLTDADFAANPNRRYAASALDRMSFWRTQAVLSYHVSFEDVVELRVAAYRHDLARTWFRLNRFRGGPSLENVLANPRDPRAAIFYSVLSGAEDSDAAGEALMIANNDRRFVSQGIQALGTWRPELFGVAHTVELGLRLHYDSIVREHTEEAYLMQSGRLVAEGTGPQRTADETGSTRAFAAHLRDEIDFGRVVVTPGVRLEVVDGLHERRLDGTVENRNTQVVVLPGIGATWQLLDELAVLAGVYRGFSPASPQAARTGPDGAAVVPRPEESTNWEAGFRFARGGTRAELVGFFNDYTNLVGDCTGSTACPDELIGRQFNGGAVHVYGLEASARREGRVVEGVGYLFQASYTLTQSRFLGGFSSDNPQWGDVERGAALPYVPQHQAALIAGAGGERWSVNAGAIWVGPMRDEAGQGEAPPERRIPGRVVLDLGADYRLFDAGRLYVRAENLLNAEYITSRRPFGARPGKPLDVLVGYRHTF